MKPERSPDRSSLVHNSVRNTSSRRKCEVEYNSMEIVMNTTASFAIQYLHIHNLGHIGKKGSSASSAVF